MLINFSLSSGIARISIRKHATWYNRNARPRLLFVLHNTRDMLFTLQYISEYSVFQYWNNRKWLFAVDFLYMQFQRNYCVNIGDTGER